jgi:hypothetical protein
MKIIELIVIAIKRFIVKKVKKKEYKIIGVTIGYSARPQLLFEKGKIFYSPQIDRLLYPEYFPDNEEWPIDPKTGERLPERIRACHL